MGGSGGGGSYYSSSPKDLAQQVRAAQDSASNAAFEAELGAHFSELLAGYNNRDHALVRKRLSAMNHVLASHLDSALDQVFGGSVAKRTFVDGLSDVDSLLFLNDSDLEGRRPEEALERLRAMLDGKTPENPNISHGAMAVTATYADGMEIQIVPALKDAGGVVRVPNPENDSWAAIDPKAFQSALSRRNEECGGKLVPVIKLAKAINATLPAEQRLSGYHIESLAIAAFKNYDAVKSTSAMLPYFIERARELVLKPIVDSTGQSVHVDEYLGAANSPERLTASHLLGGIARRMRNASAAGSIEQWDALFDDGD